MLIFHMSHVIRSNYHYAKLINMINHVRQTVKKILLKDSVQQTFTSEN